MKPNESEEVAATAKQTEDAATPGKTGQATTSEWSVGHVILAGFAFALAGLVASTTNADGVVAVGAGIATVTFGTLALEKLTVGQKHRLTKLVQAGLGGVTFGAAIGALGAAYPDVSDSSVRIGGGVGLLIVIVLGLCIVLKDESTT